MMNDEEARKRTEVKFYKIMINNVTSQTDAQSIGQALRRAGDLRLNDTDVVTVKLE